MILSITVGRGKTGIAILVEGKCQIESCDCNLLK